MFRIQILLSLCAITFTAPCWGQVANVSNFLGLERSAHRSRLGLYNNELFFGVGANGTSDRELWGYNGAIMRRVADGFVGTSPTAIDDFTEFNGNLYFTADNGLSGVELYRFDGSIVTLAADIVPGPGGSNPTGLTVHGDKLFFSVQEGDSYNNLWSFDGRQTAKITSFQNPRASVILGGTYKGDFYFGADNGSNGSELWKYDGNAVTEVADINAGGHHSFPSEFLTVGDNLYFRATSAEFGAEVWKYDGNAVSLVQDVATSTNSSDPRGLTELDGQLYFSAGSHVWTYDGTTARQLARGGGPLVIDGELYAIRGNYIEGIEFNEVWKIDGQEATYYKTLAPSSGPYAVLNDELYFTCACANRELMKIASPGDADRDGRVTFVDFLTLSGNFGRAGNWNEGDFNSDGMVAFPDFLLQSDNFGSVPQPAEESLSAVPEPGAITILMLGGLAIWCRTRSRRNLLSD